MRIKNQSEMLVSGGSSLQKALELGVERGGPVILIADGAFVEVWNQIKHHGAAIFKPIKRVLERFHAKHEMCSTIAF